MEMRDATVMIVDDDDDVREAVGRLLRAAGWRTEAFSSARDFLATEPWARAGCLVLDVRMPGMTGPQLHAWLREHDVALPVIFLSAHCDVATSVQAMKFGAFDFLEKPADADVLLPAINAAVERNHVDRIRRATDEDIARRLATLSVREREVIGYVVKGYLNKQIAADLGISEKTVKVHRGRAMAKMKVRALAQLVQLFDQLHPSR